MTAIFCTTYSYLSPDIQRKYPSVFKISLYMLKLLTSLSVVWEVQVQTSVWSNQRLYMIHCCLSAVLDIEVQALIG